MDHSEAKIYPTEVTIEQLRANCPPGWQPLVQLVWDMLEEWRAIADLTGEARPVILSWTRSKFDPDCKPFPFMEFWAGMGPGALGDFEFDKLGELCRVVGRMAKTCECCGCSRAKQVSDGRAGGDMLYLCADCEKSHHESLPAPLPPGLGLPLETVEPITGWKPDKMDREWYPGKDQEDDLADGIDDQPF